MAAKELISMRVSPEIVAEIDRLAEQSGLTKTQIIEKALIAGLAEGRKLMSYAENPLYRLMVRAVASMSGDEMESVEVDKVLKSIDRAAKRRKAESNSRGTKNDGTS